MRRTPVQSFHIAIFDFAAVQDATSSRVALPEDGPGGRVGKEGEEDAAPERRGLRLLAPVAIDQVGRGLEEEEAQTQRHGRSREIAGQSQQHQQLVSGEGRIFEAEQQQKIQYQAEHQQPPPPADGPGQQVVNHGQRRHQAQVPGRLPAAPAEKDQAAH